MDRDGESPARACRAGAAAAVAVVLVAPRARTAGPAFAAGWIAGLLAVSVVVVVLVGSASDPDGDDPGLGCLQIVIGIVFLVMAAKQRTKRPRPGKEPVGDGLAGCDQKPPPASEPASACDPDHHLVVCRELARLRGDRGHGQAQALRRAG